MSKVILSLFAILLIGSNVKAQINPTDSPYNIDGTFIVETDSNMIDLSVPLLFYYPQVVGSYPVLMFQLGANGIGSSVINRHTYDIFMHHLASYGFVVIIIDDSQAGFPTGTSFKETHDWFTANVNDSGHWLSSYADANKLVVGGHSNGGVNASALLIDRPTEVDGIIFMDAYPSTGVFGIGAHDVSGFAGKEMTMTAGENNPTASKEGYDSFTSTECKTFVNIGGLDHGGFGDYVLASQPVGSIGRAAATATIRHFLVSWMLSQFTNDYLSGNALTNLTLHPNSLDEFTNDCEGPINSAQITESQNSVNVFPNPSNDFVNVQVNIDDVNIEIFNALGQKVFTAIHQGKMTKIDLSLYPQGIYIIHLTNAEGDFITTTRLFKK